MAATLPVSSLPEKERALPKATPSGDPAPRVLRSPWADRLLAAAG